MTYNQKFVALFFSKDASTVMGFWVSQNCQPQLSVWRVRDKTKIAEHALSDNVLGPKILVDYNAEVSCFVIVHVGQVGFASVSFWDTYSLRPQRVAESDGHIGNTQDLLCVRMMGDGRHFITLSPYKMKIWTFGQQVPRMEREIEAKQPLKTCEVSGGMIYVVTEKGRILVLTLTDDKAVDSICDPGVKFQALTIGSAFIFLGTDNGHVHVYSKDRRAGNQCTKIAPPSADSMSPVIASWAVTHITSGANDDYVIISFADGTYGVVHMGSEQYVALHMGHSSPIRAVAMAPRLGIRPGRLASRLQDPDRYVESQAFTFLTVAKDTNWITWRSGPPFRDSIFRQMPPPAIPGSDPNLYSDLEVFAPLTAPHHMPGEQPLELTAVSFKPEAFLSNDGRLPGAYELLVGTQDSGLYLLVLEESEPIPGSQKPTKLQWSVKRVRPESPELSERGPEAIPSLMPPTDHYALPDPLVLPDWAPGDAVAGYRTSPDVRYGGSPPKNQPKAVCCDLTFSRCLKLVVASYTNGFSELLQYPELQREMVVQHPCMAPVAVELCRAKACFVWKPIEEDRAYDQNHYLLSHSSEPQELVLFEVYKIGANRAKTCRHTYRLPVHPHYGAREANGRPALHTAAAITDFQVHPSQCFVVVAAALATAEHSARAYVFDLWDGQMLSCTTLFSSPLIASNALRPRICLDSVGAFIFCSSTPTVIGVPEQIQGTRDALGVAGLMNGMGPGGLPQDSCLRPNVAMPPPQVRSSSDGVSLTSSVVCIIDFSTGLLLHQTSFEVSYMRMGSLAHDITWLLMGAHDGTLSVWRPPEPVSEVIRQTLEASKREYTTHKARSGGVVEHSRTEILEEAIAWHWYRNLRGRINWSKWAFDAQASPGTAMVQQGPGEHQLPPILQKAAPPSGGVGHDAQFMGIPPQGPPQATPPPWMQDNTGGPAGQNDADDVVVQARQGWPPQKPQGLSMPPPFVGGGPPLSALAGAGTADLLPHAGNAMLSPFGGAQPRSAAFLGGPSDDDVFLNAADHRRALGVQAAPMREPTSEWPGPQHAFSNDREAARWGDAHRGDAQNGFSRGIMHTEVLESRHDNDRDRVFITQPPSDSNDYPRNGYGHSVTQMPQSRTQALWNDMVPIPGLSDGIQGPSQDESFAVVDSMFADIDRFETRIRANKQAASGQ